MSIRWGRDFWRPWKAGEGGGGKQIFKLLKNSQSQDVRIVKRGDAQKPEAHGTGLKKGSASGIRMRGSRVLRILLWALGCLLFVFSARHLWSLLERSSLFALEQIEIQGCERSRQETILALSGTRRGMNLVALDTGHVSRKLEAYPPVRSADVVKRFPRCLLVRIQEREPAVLVGIRDDLFYMDDTGVVFSRVVSRGLVDLPLITGLDAYPWTPGRRQEGRKIQAALTLLRTLRNSGLLGRLSEIHVDPSKGLSFYLEAFPVQIRIGWERFRERVVKLERILPLIVEKQRGILSVDLRFDHQVVTRQRERTKQRMTRYEREGPFREEDRTHTEETLRGRG